MKNGQITRIKFISDGFKAILASDGVRKLVTEQTAAIKARADANISGKSVGYNMKIYPPGGRWIGIVGTTDHASIVAEAEEKALSRAVR